MLFWLILCLTVLLNVSACGRKTDPVPIIPPMTSSPESESGGAKDTPPSAEDITEGETRPPSEQEYAITPNPPSGLTAVFTGTAVVLSWNEVTDQDFAYYVIYRSSAEDPLPIGKTNIPIFTDRNIILDTIYRYSISVVSKREGPRSIEIRVHTALP